MKKRNWLWRIARKLGMKIAILFNGDITMKGGDGRLVLVNGEVPDAIYITGSLTIPDGESVIMDNTIHLEGDWRIE